MLNWIYYQLAMYYLRKSRSVPMYTVRWLEYTKKSLRWIEKVRKSIEP